ncbi:MAG TPA: MerR family transcriptional regulator [Polyangiaceae bacterium]|jgi:DNA-binding transcriptional MerR regulator|nr:MerR family transcriptional regulator [Polyangiaceae bacterium]
MKVSELSRRSQVPLPTIKFYIREGLLPAGTRTGKNQAEYSEEHLERLGLIRALRDEAGLSVAAIGRALKAADSSDEFIEAAIDAIERPSGPEVDEKSKEFRAARDAVVALAGTRGWEVDPKSAALRDAARALTVITRSFYPEAADPAVLAPYAEAASLIAQHEIPDGWEPNDAPNAALRYAVLGTVLLEPLILAIRRMAHVARSRQMAVAAGTTARPARKPAK